MLTLILAALLMQPPASPPIPPGPLLDISATYNKTEQLIVLSRPFFLPAGKTLTFCAYTTGKDGETIAGRPRTVKVETGHVYLSGSVRWHGTPATYRLNVWDGTKDVDLAKPPAGFPAPLFTLSVVGRSNRLLFERSKDGEPLALDEGMPAMIQDMTPPFPSPPPTDADLLAQTDAEIKFLESSLEDARKRRAAIAAKAEKK